MDGLSAAERAALERARVKRAEGMPLTREERRAVDKRRAHVREQLFLEHVEALPQRVYADLSGKHPATLKRHAGSFGIPCGGRTVDLRAVLHAMHRLLSERKNAILADESVDDLVGSDADSPALERIRRLQAEKLEIELEKLRGELVEVERVRPVFRAFAEGASSIVDQVARAHGDDAGNIVAEGLRALLDTVQRELGNVDGAGDE